VRNRQARIGGELLARLDERRGAHAVTSSRTAAGATSCCWRDAPRRRKRRSARSLSGLQQLCARAWIRNWPRAVAAGDPYPAAAHRPGAHQECTTSSRRTYRRPARRRAVRRRQVAHHTFGRRPPRRGRQRTLERSAGHPRRTAAGRRLAAVQVARHPAQPDLDRRPAAGVCVCQLPRDQEARPQAPGSAAIAGRRHDAMDRRPGIAIDGPLLSG